MKKKLTLIFIGLILSSSIFAEGEWITKTSGTKDATTLQSEGFETYSVGDYIAVQDGALWAPWGDAAGSSADGLVSDVQAHTGVHSLSVTGSTDLIYKLGDKTSGVFTVDFWYYVVPGKKGYYNFQKKQNEPGSEFAFEVFLNNGGSGVLKHDGDHNFTFTQDSWILIQHTIDLNADLITLTIEGTQIHQWQFSINSGGAVGSKKLGGIDFYAGSGTTYFMDDLEFVELTAAIEPAELELSALNFTTDGSASETLTITNSGAEDLTFETAISYDFTTKNSNIVNSDVINNSNSKVVMLTSPSISKLDKTIIYDIDSKDGTLTNFDGTADGSLGWGGTSNVNADVASLFKYDAIKDYIGMDVSSVVIFANDLPVSGSSNLKVYDGRDGLVSGPINLLESQAFTPVLGDQVIVSLNNPVKITGKDLFVGWGFTQVAGEHCATMDAAITDDANWTKTGPSWNELTEVTFGDFGIIAILTGDASHKWLTLDTYSGTIAPAANQAIQLNFDLTDMASGSYTANLIVKTNDGDDNESYNEIPVTLNVPVGIEGGNKVGLMIYPNPAKDILNISSNENIKNIKAVNITGKTVLNISTNSKTQKVSLSNLAKGVYMFTIATETQTITEKVIVK